MSVTYDECDTTTRKLIEQVAVANHKPLIEHKLDIRAQFCTGKDEAPAIKVGGRETFGKVKILPPDDRAAGAPDIRISLDKTKWKAASTDEQQAWVDELLQSVEIRMTVGEAPEPLRYEDGSLKLKRRRPDLFMSAFYDVHVRHQRNSTAFAQVKSMQDRFTQLQLFNASEPSAFETKAKGKGKQQQPTMQMAQ